MKGGSLQNVKYDSFAQIIVDPNWVRIWSDWLDSDTHTSVPRQEILWL